MSNPTLLTIAQAKGNQKNTVYTADLAKKSGLMRTMWWQKANGGLKHYYNRAVELPTGEFRSINAGVTPGDVTTEAGTIDLMCLEALHQVDRDIVDKYPGGLTQYVADKSPGYLYGLGATFSRQLVYGTGNDDAGFKGLRQIALANGNTVNTYASGSGSDYTSIVAVRWAMDECTGLYDEKSMEDGLVNIDIHNNRNWIYKTVNGKEYPLYQFSYHGFFGLQSLGNKNVAALLGVKDATNYLPEAEDIDKILDMVLAETDGSTYLYMNRKARRLLSKLKNDKLQLTAFDTDMGMLLDTWNGIPIIIEDNISSNETRTS